MTDPTEMARRIADELTGWMASTSAQKDAMLDDIRLENRRLRDLAQSCVCWLDVLSSGESVQNDDVLAVRELSSRIASFGGRWA